MITGKNWSFVLFSVGLPVVLYLVFSQMFSPGDGGGYDWAAMTMVSMAAYGSLGAAMAGGAQLAVERRSGWFRQLTITALPPRSFLWAKAGVIMLLVLPALILVYLAGLLVGGVRLPVLVWLASLGLMWLALVPMAILGTRDRAVGQGRGRARGDHPGDVAARDARRSVVPGPADASGDADDRPQPCRPTGWPNWAAIRSWAAPGRGPASACCWPGPRD